MTTMKEQPDPCARPTVPDTPSKLTPMAHVSGRQGTSGRAPQAPGRPSRWPRPRRRLGIRGTASTCNWRARLEAGRVRSSARSDGHLHRPKARQGRHSATPPGPSSGAGFAFAIDASLSASATAARTMSSPRVAGVSALRAEQGSSSCHSSRSTREHPRCARSRARLAHPHLHPRGNIRAARGAESAMIPRRIASAGTSALRAEPSGCAASSAKTRREHPRCARSRVVDGASRRRTSGNIRAARGTEYPADADELYVEGTSALRAEPRRLRRRRFAGCWEHPRCARSRGCRITDRGV